MKFLSFLIVAVGVLIGCSPVRPGMQSAKPINPANEKARAIYAEIVSNLSKAQSLKVVYTIDYSKSYASGYDYTGIDSEGILTFLKPGLMRVDDQEKTIVKDEDQITTIYKDPKQYEVQSSIQNPPIDLDGFFPFRSIIKGDAPTNANLIEWKNENGKDLVAVHTTIDGVIYDTYYSVETKLPIRCSIRSVGDIGVLTYLYRKVILDPSIPRSVFVANTKGYSLLGDYGVESLTIRVGMKMPDFTITTIDSKTLNLAGLLQGNKAVIVTFFSYG